MLDTTDTNTVMDRQFKMNARVPLSAVRIALSQGAADPNGPPHPEPEPLEPEIDPEGPPEDNPDLNPPSPPISNPEI